jgi:hypothetical protein
MHISPTGARFDARKVLSIAIVIVPCLLMILLAIPSSPPQQQARAATGELLICSMSGGDQFANGVSANPSISLEGRYVAFESEASNLIPNDTNGNRDIFRKDLATKEVVCCSRNQSGLLGNSYSIEPVISADGRYVAFTSFASNLVAGDSDPNSDVFRKDLVTGEIACCSTTSTGDQISNPSKLHDMSSDGRYVLLSYSNSTFRKDINTGELQICWAYNDSGSSTDECISADGTHVVFASNLTNLVPIDNNEKSDVFVKDMTDGTIELCSAAADGTQADEASFYTVDISADNRFVIFMSSATNLVDGVSESHLYRKDLQTGEVKLCDCNAVGTPAHFPDSNVADISSDGRFVVFGAYSADELSPRACSGYSVFRKDLVNGNILCCNDNSWGDGGYNGLSGKNPSISGDGQFVAFQGGSKDYIYRKNPLLERPAITGINPSHARINEDVTIEGYNFGSSRGDSTVSFDSVPAIEYTHWSDRSITVKIPRAEYKDSKIDIRVTNQAGWYEYYDFQLDTYDLCFAEGYTGSGFQEYLCIANTYDFQTIVTIDYLLPDRYYDEQVIYVPANSRVTIDVNSRLPDTEVSIYTSSLIEIVAERPMYFNYGDGWTGGHDAVASRYISTDWFFAEGYTGSGFDEWICVLNLDDTDANLTFHFQTQEEGEVVRTAVVPVASRGSFKVNDLLGANYQCSLWLESDRYVVAERSMYFDYMGMSAGHWEGGHCVMGVPYLSKEYYFAEGTTRSGFEEWLTLQNPTDSTIDITATYQMQAGQGDPVMKKYTVGSGQRFTVFVPDEVGMEKDVSIKLTSGSYFLAERPMYFSYSGAWEGGHCVIGAMQTSKEWFFAEGYTGPGFDEWLCLQNPGDKESTVEVTYLTQEAGALAPKTVKVGANSRVTILVNSDAGPNYQLSTKLLVTSGPGIVAERPMYFDFNGWDGGHDVVGYAPEPASSLSYQDADSTGPALILPGLIDSSWKKK